MDQETREQFRKMDKRMVRLEEMLSTLIQIVGATNAGLEETQAEFREGNARLRTEVKQGIADFRAEVKQEISDFRAKFISAQERQERILEILSLKSIETDAYLHDFKRRLQIS